MKPFLTTLFVFTFVIVNAQIINTSAYTTKYDFVSGEKIIAIEDFNETEIGDFPARWSTNATAEIVALPEKSGKWMKINKQSVFLPEFIKSLPENFTLEFDLGVNAGWNSLPFVINFTNLKTPKEYTNYYHYVDWKGTHAVHLEFRPLLVDQRAGSSTILAGKNGNHEVDNSVEFKNWDNASNNFAHISFWRQNKRLRVYLNGEKIWDIQNVFDAESTYNAMTIAMQGSYKLEDYFLLGNIRLAAGAPDIRKKIAKEGKIITRGILFNTGSDEIKPESYGVLKEIGNVLKDSLRNVKIIGHTDDEGDDKINMELSVRRANAIKNYLVSNFGLPANNFTIEGKGESAPIEKNSTAEGRANNRRVEFVLLPITVKPN